MGKHIEYSTEKELDLAIEKLMRDDPHGVAISEHIKVAGCFVMRVDDTDQTLPGKGDPVTLKKVPPEMQILMRPKAAFVLVVDYHFWQTAPEEQKRGYLGLAISRIRVKKTENGLKVGTRKYDVQTNIAVISKYGLFTENMSLLGEAVSKLTKTQLAMAQAMVDRLKVKPAPPAKNNGEDDEDESQAKARQKQEENEPEEKMRPPRRPPPDPEPKPVAEEEVEPED